MSGSTVVTNFNDPQIAKTLTDDPTGVVDTDDTDDNGGADAADNDNHSGDNDNQGEDGDGDTP